MEIYVANHITEVHERPFQINQPTRCNNFSSLLLDVYPYV